MAGCTFFVIFALFRRGETGTWFRCLSYYKAIKWLQSLKFRHPFKYKIKLALCDSAASLNAPLCMLPFVLVAFLIFVFICLFVCFNNLRTILFDFAYIHVYFSGTSFVPSMLKPLFVVYFLCCYLCCVFVALLLRTCRFRDVRRA